MSTYEQLQHYLDAVVPLKIIMLIEEGGPKQEHFQRCAGLIDMLHNAVPSMMTIEQRSALAQGIAILSFVSGGVELFGRHWRAEAMADR